MLFEGCFDIFTVKTIAIAN